MTICSNLQLRIKNATKCEVLKFIEKLEYTDSARSGFDELDIDPLGGVVGFDIDEFGEFDKLDVFWRLVGVDGNESLAFPFIMSPGTIGFGDIEVDAVPLEPALAP